MKIKKFIFNPFGENTYIIWDESSKNAAIIDPGMINRSEQAAVSEFIDSNRLNLRHLINTHLHIDHAAGNKFIEDTYTLKTEADIADTYLAQRLTEQARMFGLAYNDGNLTIAGLPDKMEIAGERCEILQIPGHTQGHIALYFPDSRVVFSGDALFQMSIGRTDLPGGDYDTLIDSISQKLLTLPDTTVVLPGHGPQTTVGFEAANNPYL